MKRPRPRLERAWIVIATVLIGAVAIIVVGSLMASDRQSDIWVEVVSRASQLIVLAVAGGVVGAVVHDRDAAREDERRRQAYLLGFVDEVEAAFTQVKTARRLLRTFGFDAPRESRLTPEQVEGFRTQMALLNDAELQFETLARRVDAMPRQFGSVASQVVVELTAIHTHLNEVLRDWQADPSTMAQGAPGAALATWPRFQAFVAYGPEPEASFRFGVADRVTIVELLVQGLGDGDSTDAAGAARSAGKS